MNTWSWEVSPDGYLSVVTKKETLFTTTLKASKTINMPKSGVMFSGEDEKLYTIYKEYLSFVPNKFMEVLAIECVAHKKYYQKSLPQSWYYHRYDNVENVVIGNVVTLVSKCNSIGQFLVIDVDNTSDESICLLINLNEDFYAKPNKILKYKEAIRVMKYCIQNIEEMKVKLRQVI